MEMVPMSPPSIKYLILPNPNPAYIIAAMRVYGKVHTLVSTRAELTEIKLEHNPQLLQLNVANNSV